MTLLLQMVSLIDNRNLFCLTLSHSIDDRDVIERYLSEYPNETEACIPIALHHAFDIKVPSPTETMEYLHVLWYDYNLDERLIIAARRGLTDLIPYLLDKGATDIDSALCESACSGNIATVRLLLERKADIHTDDDCTLSNAAYCCSIDVMNFLLTQTNYSRDSLSDAIISASGSDHRDKVIPIISMLLDHRADLHHNEDQALILAAMYNNIETVRFLLDNRADVHARSDYVLIPAAENGNEDIVKLLLDRGVNPHTHGMKALAGAVREAHINIIKLLASHL
jgi:ankyrin repeat protein